MAKFRFTADETRIFGDLSLEVAPGDVVDFDDDPPGPGDWWAAVTDDEAVVPAADATPAEGDLAPAPDVAPPDVAPDTPVVDAPPPAAPAVPADQAEE